MFDFIFNKRKKVAAWYNEKTEYMEKMMGKEFGIVSHSIIPFENGGGFDLYYYPSFYNGTAVVTKELCNYKFNGPKNTSFDGYELVMVSSNTIDLTNMDLEMANAGTFQHDLSQINDSLNILGRYASVASLDKYDTLEIPLDIESVGGKCFVFDTISDEHINFGKNKFGLMLAIEIHRDEMEFAQKFSSKALLEHLKEQKIYPFTGTYRDSIAEKINN